MSQLPNRLEPRPGIVSSGQPDQAALAALADAGFVGVIDLRGGNENRGFDEPAAVAELGMRYLSLPIATADDMNYDNAAALDEFLAAVDGPVLVHCGSGNRVGGILALRERLRGATAEDAFTTGLAGGLSSPALIELVGARLEER